MDCTLNGDLCKENNVQYFPFLQLYHQGSAIEIYPPRERNWDKLVEYITTQSEKYAPSTTQVSVPNPAGLSIDMDGPALANAQKSGQPLFIKYYAPWCPHCQHMAPAWERMASDLARQINVGEVNCDDHRDVCIENGVTSFPTLVLYAHGNAYEYHDDRSLVSLVGFAKKKAGPMIRQADSTQLENVLKEDPVAFVYIHKDGTDSAMVSRLCSYRRLCSSPLFACVSRIFCKMLQRNSWMELSFIQQTIITHSVYSISHQRIYQQH